MGEFSAISWTNHTYNPWRGCTKVGPPCDFCYAEARDQRYEGGIHWGVGAPRIRATESTRNGVLKIARKIREGAIPPGQNRVFSLSLGDVFDNEIDPSWRDEFWDKVRATPELRYQLVTKRVGNAAKMLPAAFPKGFEHVGIIATTGDQAEVDRDLPKLLRLKADRGVSWVGLSIEPQLGLVRLPARPCGLDWAITGGESRQPLHGRLGVRPRPYDPNWARELIAGGAFNGVAIFVKQMGANPIGLPAPADGMGKDPAEWPADIRVQDFPDALA